VGLGLTVGNGVIVGVGWIVGDGDFSLTHTVDENELLPPAFDAVRVTLKVPAAV
jgi:hypothetical protein